MRKGPAVVVSPDFMDAGRVADGLEAEELASDITRMAIAADSCFGDSYHSCR